MKGFASTRLILLHPSLPKHAAGAGSPPATPLTALLCSHHRLCLVAFLSFLTFASLLTLLNTAARPPNSTPLLPHAAVPVAGPLPPHLFDALLHYACKSVTAGQMADFEIRAVAGVLRSRGPCNLLVFGLGPESLLWHSLNHGGRTVFVDENQYYIAHYEERHPGLEGYDVAYATKVSDLQPLLADARASVAGDCRPVQNLLFSDCRLAINDLPNHLYEVAWDVILVDGPRGYSPESPGRMSAIYTAAVLARSGGAGPTDVLVHDYGREVERVCSAEFLCEENLAAAADQLAHFVIHGGAATRKDDFCFNRSTTSTAAILPFDQPSMGNISNLEILRHESQRDQASLSPLYPLPVKLQVHEISPSVRFARAVE
ncbi:Protein irregular xylem 15 [Apostasia shenzhenica]|uniref:Protein irregular xylem 15 n=1 Tax=Apostasia shenzhenica TaxID=1088818 RepID=A0A2I0A7D4_9ASPA|nr:Protein irregular xylem 15 [Apostasia shenzhenica]